MVRILCWECKLTTELSHMRVFYALLILQAVSLMVRKSNTRIARNIQIVSSIRTIAGLIKSSQLNP